MNRILLADDQEALRRRVRATLTGAGFDVCGEAQDGREAVEKASQLRPDAVVLDITMPGMNGLDAARILQKILPEIPIVVLTMHESRQLIEEARRLGVRGYVNKSHAGRDLIPALQAVLGNNIFFPAGA
ncbi:MAG TPA: response regulator transcription factor [Terriglobales bacterium]|nr:response regulator transcription factor [Terriglobales bacterium]